MDLFYTEVGEGEALVLLHGNGESSEYFVHQLTYFSKYYRCFALDTRGHGRSPRGEGEFSLKRFAIDLEEFRLKRSLAHFTLLGFSDGGNIALLYALAHPEVVTHLILCGANIYPEGLAPAELIPICIAYGKASILAAQGDEKARRRKELLALMVKEPHIAPEELQKLTMPALVIAGTEDMILREHTQLIASSLPQGKLVILPGTHFVARENPEAFNEAVASFLTRS